jgi:hypothetical protein
LSTNFGHVQTVNRQPSTVNRQPSTVKKMSAKKSFVLRLDDAAYAALEKWAADEFRSVNGQLEWIISKALKDAGRTPKAQKPKPEAEDPEK